MKTLRTGPSFGDRVPTWFVPWLAANPLPGIVSSDLHTSRWYPILFHSQTIQLPYGRFCVFTNVLGVYPYHDPRTNSTTLWGHVSSGQENPVSKIFAFLHGLCPLLHGRYPALLSLVAQNRVMQFVTFREPDAAPAHLSNGDTPSYQQQIPML